MESGLCVKRYVPDRPGVLQPWLLATSKGNKARVGGGGGVAGGRGGDDGGDGADGGEGGDDGRGGLGGGA